MPNPSIVQVIVQCIVGRDWSWIEQECDANLIAFVSCRLCSQLLNQPLESTWLSSSSSERKEEYQLSNLHNKIMNNKNHIAHWTSVLFLHKTKREWHHCCRLSCHRTYFLVRAFCLPLKQPPLILVSRPPLHIRVKEFVAGIIGVFSWMRQRDANLLYSFQVLFDELLMSTSVGFLHHQSYSSSNMINMIFYLITGMRNIFTIHRWCKIRTWRYKFENRKCILFSSWYRSGVEWATISFLMVYVFLYHWYYY